ncbi:hypothetical protein Aperf_G00000097422 [Anoplocephala perfoliata]
MAYFHENVGEIMKVVDPVWRILSSHASFILSLFTSTASLLLTGGSVVLNVSFSLLIFLSTLFYLLAASERTYLPLDFVVSLTPQRGEASPVVICFYASVEAAVASVVVTTLKRTVFYGMYTLLTHTLFGLDIVVLPSIIATILGAIPLMGTYWAVLPGVVELWCLRGSYWQALLLLLLHLLPYYFLDTALYTEIKGVKAFIIDPLIEFFCFFPDQSVADGSAFWLYFAIYMSTSLELSVIVLSRCTQESSASYRPGTQVIFLVFGSLLPEKEGF